MATSEYEKRLTALALQMQQASFRNEEERQAFGDAVMRLIRGYDPARPDWLAGDERALFEQLQQTADSGVSGWSADLARSSVPPRDDDYVAAFVDQMVEENGEMVAAVRALSAYDLDRIVVILTQTVVAEALRQWNAGGRDFFPGIVRDALANMPGVQVRERILAEVFDESPTDSPSMGL